MPINVIAEISLRPEAAEQGIAEFQGILPDTRTFDGCLGVELLVSQDEPGHIVLVEKWESRAHHERYMSWRSESGSSSVSRDIFVAPVRLSYFDTREG